MSKVKTKNQPIVSVLITSYNAMPYLVAAVEGIVNQTYTNWELIVIDDHSTDFTMEYLNSLRNEKITAQINPKKGRGSALNYGLTLCQGKYIAINDADDYSLPKRLSTQVSFLEANPEYGLVGSHSVLKDLLTGEVVYHQRPTEWEEIKKTFTKGQPIQHVTVLMRHDLIKKIGGYNEKIQFLFDREIFLRLGRITKLANLPDVLVEVGHHHNRHFYFKFKGIHREYYSLKYRILAINQFGFPKHYIVREVLFSIFALIPEKIRKIIINIYKYINGKN